MNIKLVAICACAVALAGCSGTKQKLGLTRKAPDEFAVVKRAPLSMPPSMAELQQPRPGAPRPQEQATSEQAKEAVFGSSGQDGGSYSGEGETALLARAGAGHADPKIRQRVDAETEEMQEGNIPVARRLFGLGGDPNSAPVSVVNAKEEAERLQANKDQGKPVTAGETPTVKK